MLWMMRWEVCVCVRPLQRAKRTNLMWIGWRERAIVLVRAVGLEWVLFRVFWARCLMIKANIAVRLLTTKLSWLCHQLYASRFFGESGMKRKESAWSRQLKCRRKCSKSALQRTLLVHELNDGRWEREPRAIGIKAVKGLEIVCELYTIAVMEFPENLADLYFEPVG